mmetsp:Transcript_10569/g.22710  ORF Transcript_10569/g.22710 Transcript_10569/m.22710 type:complete len:90 (-) Transcript_10569:1533-1802(-)
MQMPHVLSCSPIRYPLDVLSVIHMVTQRVLAHDVGLDLDPDPGPGPKPRPPPASPVQCVATGEVRVLRLLDQQEAGTRCTHRSRLRPRT